MKKWTILFIITSLNISIYSRASFANYTKLFKTSLSKKVGFGLLTSATTTALYFYHRTTPKNDISKVSDLSLKKFYQLPYQGIPFHIPEKHLKNVESVKKFFKHNNVHPRSGLTWDDPEEEQEIKDLLKTPRQSYPPDIKELSQIIKDAEIVLKYFLFSNDPELADIIKHSVRKRIFYNLFPNDRDPNDIHYIEKSELPRLFTYAFLQRIINTDKLSHLHLTRRKILAIRHTNPEDIHNPYLSHDQAIHLLDKNLKIHISANPPQILEIGYDEQYNFAIFAYKETNSDIPLSFGAYNELKILLSKAPFDVGVNNIFSDPNGDAIIIDTEFKGGSSKEGITKLGRYPFQRP